MTHNLLNHAKWSLHHKNAFSGEYIFMAREIPGLKKNFLYQPDDPMNLKPRIDLISKLKITNDYLKADYVFVPHPWISIKRNYSYLEYLVKLSTDVPLIIANSDDISPKCDLPNTLQLRSFLHPKENEYRKIIMPYPAKQVQSELRSWKPVPQVSFIGYVPKFSFGSLTSMSTSFIKSPIKSSVFLNRKISLIRLNNLRHVFKVVCIPRVSFTLTSENGNLNSHKREYEKNLQESDYVVCPRGFGNTSIRFYETLSAGATPILVNSGSDLPKISLDNFWKTNVLQLELFSDWGKAISKDWDFLKNNTNYFDRQQANKEIFAQELHLEKYARKIFSNYIF